MELRDKIRTVLKEHYGEFNTYLEHEYEERITVNLIEGDVEKKKAWMTYNQVVIELKNILKNQLMLEKLQYKLTDEINPRQACIEVLNEVKNKTPELERLYDKIKNFK